MSSLSSPIVLKRQDKVSVAVGWENLATWKSGNNSNRLFFPKVISLHFVNQSTDLSVTADSLLNPVLTLRYHVDWADHGQEDQTSGPYINIPLYKVPGCSFTSYASSCSSLHNFSDSSKMGQALQTWNT